MTPQQLANAIGCSVDRARKWQTHLINAMTKFGISGRVETASFLAQIAHESALLAVMEENLNYSAEGLAKTWPHRYAQNGKPNGLALRLHRNPRAIANNCYANRMGNGNEASGDGWLYRGRGAIQITGKNNYRACGLAIGIDLLRSPDKLLEPEYASLSAGWFWSINKLDAHDDDFNVLAETKLINGGTNGLAHRQALFNKAVRALS